MDRNTGIRNSLGLGIGLLTLVACLWILYTTLDGHWDTAIHALTPVVGLIALVAIGLHGAANAMLAAQWGRMLNALGAHLPRRVVAWLWTRAQLTRYAIGSAGLVSRPVLANRRGVPWDIGTSTTLLESVWLMAILGMGLPFASAQLHQLSALIWIVGIGCCLLVIGLTVIPGIVLTPLQWIRPNLVTKGLDEHGVIITTGYIAQLVLRAIAFVALAIAINPAAMGYIPTLLGAFATSYLVGWLFIFSPGGLGPREAVAGVMLAQAGLDGGQVVALVALARLVEVIGELAYVAMVSRPQGSVDEPEAQVEPKTEP